MATGFQTLNNRSQVHEFFRNLERLGKQGFKIDCTFHVNGRVDDVVNVDDLSRFPIEVTEIITGNTIHYVVIEPRR
jgi:hypothetical protein